MKKSQATDGWDKMVNKYSVVVRGQTYVTEAGVAKLRSLHVRRLPVHSQNDITASEVQKLIDEWASHSEKVVRVLSSLARDLDSAAEITRQSVIKEYETEFRQ